MIHNNLSDGNSFGLSPCAGKDFVLLQLNDHRDGEQVRVSLLPDEATHIAARLIELAESARLASNPYLKATLTNAGCLKENGPLL